MSRVTRQTQKSTPSTTDPIPNSTLSTPRKTTISTSTTKKFAAPTQSSKQLAKRGSQVPLCPGNNNLVENTIKKVVLVEDEGDDSFVEVTKPVELLKEPIKVN